MRLLLILLFCAPVHAAVAPHPFDLVPEDNTEPVQTMLDCISHYRALPPMIRDLLGLEYLLNCLTFPDE